MQERVGIGGWPVWFVGAGGWAVHKQVGSLVGPGCVIAGTDGWTCAVLGTGFGSGCRYRRRTMREQGRAWLCCALWAPPLPPFMVSLASLQLPVPPPTFLFSVLRASASLLRAPLLPSGQVPMLPPGLGALALPLFTAYSLGEEGWTQHWALAPQSLLHPSCSPSPLALPCCGPQGHRTHHCRVPSLQPCPHLSLPLSPIQLHSGSGSSWSPALVSSSRIRGRGVGMGH